MKSKGEYEVALLKRQKVNQVMIVAAAIAIIIVVIVISFKIHTYSAEKYESIIKELEDKVEELSDPIAVYEEATREVNIRAINAEIRDIGELATIEYFYTDAGKFEDAAELFGKEIPFSFTTKSFIAKWDGFIKAGVDISKVKAEVDEERKEIIICIPRAQILSHEIDEENIETLDEKNGLFNRIKVEDIRKFDAISKESMEQKAIEKGLLDKALKNAKDIIYKLVYTDVVRELDYRITFEMEE